MVNLIQSGLKNFDVEMKLRKKAISDYLYRITAWVWEQKPSHKVNKIR